MQGAFPKSCLRRVQRRQHGCGRVWSTSFVLVFPCGNRQWFSCDVAFVTVWCRLGVDARYALSFEEMDVSGLENDRLNRHRASQTAFISGLFALDTVVPMSAMLYSSTQYSFLVARNEQPRRKCRLLAFFGLFFLFELRAFGCPNWLALVSVLLNVAGKSPCTAHISKRLASGLRVCVSTYTCGLVQHIIYIYFYRSTNR